VEGSYRAATSLNLVATFMLGVPIAELLHGFLQIAADRFDGIAVELGPIGFPFESIDVALQQVFEVRDAPGKWLDVFFGSARVGFAREFLGTHFDFFRGRRFILRVNHATEHSVECRERKGRARRQKTGVRIREAEDSIWSGLGAEWP